MDAVEFLVNKARYCIFSGCNCENCQIFNECASDLDSLTKKQAERMVDVVEQWAKEHPVKTRQSELLKMFPSALTADGLLCICPRTLDLKTYGTDSGCIHMRDGVRCKDCRRDFWLKEID